MKKICLLLTITLLTINAYSQPAPQNWNWYFGRHISINFSSGSPIQMPNSAMNAFSGCASISDNTGNLLFYTEGRTVWSRNNMVMPNGTNLNGGLTEVQIVSIVPKPDSANIYYVFTNFTLPSPIGLCYSEVDMSLNAGYGDVTVKNVQLVDSTMRKMTVVRHCNGHDYWVIVRTFNGNSYYAYLVTAAGISAPVITNIGVSIIYASSDGGGVIKASPNCKKLAETLLFSGTVQLYDFDNSTGILSNLITFPIGLNNGNCNAMSFSSDNQKLYVSNNALYQYDVSSNNQASIIASQFPVDLSSTYHNCLQLGPDNKIYIDVDNTHFLNVINYPNVLGIGCNYMTNVVPLGGDTCRFGLPNFYDGYNNYAPSTTIDTAICFNAMQLTATAIGSSYLWNTGDTTQSISVSSSGTYSVQVAGVTTCSNILDTFHVTIIPPFIVNLGPDSSICSGDSILLDAGNAGSLFLWSNGATTQTITISAAGNYWVQVTNGACTVSNSVNITINNFPLPHASFTVDTLSGCKPLIVHLTNTSTNATSYWWHFSEGGTSTVTDPVHSYSHSGTYTITLVAYDSTTCGIFTDTSVQTYYYTVFLPPTLPIITQHGDTLIVTNYTTGLQWLNNSSPIAGATNLEYIVTSNGCYYVEETDTNGCISKSDSICFTTGVNELISNKSVVIYPNPNNGTFTINSQFSTPNSQLTIKDVVGRTVYSTIINNSKQKEQINITTLPNGVYFYQITNSIQTIRGKIIKQ